LCTAQEREQFALVFPPAQAKSTVATDELAGEHLSAENYEVGLVVTMASAGSEAAQQQLQLRYWLILTNQRELFPRLSLDSKHRLVTRVTPQTRTLADGIHYVLLQCLCYSLEDVCFHSNQADVVAQWLR